MVQYSYNGMIVQYYLSIYGISFFHIPSFSNFVIRVINQQNGEVTQSQVLYPQKLQENSFPIQIKIKGYEQIVLKIKLISIEKGKSQDVVGEGVTNLGKITLDTTTKVPIYDSKAGIEEIVFCNIEFLVSGHEIGKKKGKKKDNNLSGEYEETILSHMSYTVESDHSNVQKEFQQMKPSQLSSEEDESSMNQGQRFIQERSDKLEKYNFLEQSQESHQKEEIQEDEEVSQTQKNSEQEEDQIEYPLNNTVYLSESSKKKSIPNQKMLDPSSNVKTLHHPLVSPQSTNKFESSYFDNSIGERQNGLSLNQQKIKQKVKESQQIVSKLKNYLTKYQKREENEEQSMKELDVQNEIRNSAEGHTFKKKRRNRPVKIEQMASYNSQNTFVKYHHHFQNKATKIIKNIKVINKFQSKKKQYQKFPFQKLIFLYNTHQKCVTFNSQGYRQFCSQNSIKQEDVEIKIPDDGEKLRVVVLVGQKGEFNGTIEPQNGQQIKVQLKISQESQYQFSSKDIFLCYDCKNQPPALKSSFIAPPIHMNQKVSERRNQEIMNSDDVKSRVKSYSLQPWNYGYSYLNEQKMKEQEKYLDKTQSEKQEMSVEKKKSEKSFSKRKSSVILPKLSSKASVKSNITENVKKEGSAKQTKIVFSSEDEKPRKSIPLKQSFASQPSEVEERSRSLQKTSFNSSKLENRNKKEINEINRLRNGNRNNYRFKQTKKVSSEKDEHEPKLKVMWEQLLLKKKVEQDQMQEENMQKSQFKNINNFSKVKNQRIYKKSWMNSEEQSKGQKIKVKSRTSNLYGLSSGANELIKVDKNWQKDTINENQSFPLRKMTLEINNIAICQPQVAIDEDVDEPLGKFVKFSVKRGVTYFTQIIFNEEFNSILWKLSNCVFSNLSNSERLQIEVYSTLNNKIFLMGKASIRISKLFFLRNNHIYNSSITHNGKVHCEFTLGFQIQQFCPFQVIRQEEDETLVTFSRKNMSFQERQPSNHFNVRHPSSIVLNNAKRSRNSQKKKYGSLQLEYQQDMNETLKKSQGSMDGGKSMASRKELIKGKRQS